MSTPSALANGKALEAAIRSRFPFATERFTVSAYPVFGKYNVEVFGENQAEVTDWLRRKFPGTSYYRRAFADYTRVLIPVH